MRYGSQLQLLPVAKARANSQRLVTENPLARAVLLSKCRTREERHHSAQQRRRRAGGGGRRKHRLSSACRRGAARRSLSSLTKAASLLLRGALLNERVTASRASSVPASNAHRASRRRPARWLIKTEEPFMVLRPDSKASPVARGLLKISVTPGTRKRTSPVNASRLKVSPQQCYD